MLTTIAGVKLHKFEFRWSLIRGRPFFSSSRAYKTCAGRRGFKTDVRFFQNLMTILFQQNRHFGFFICTLLGEGGC